MATNDMPEQPEFQHIIDPDGNETIIRYTDLSTTAATISIGASNSSGLDPFLDPFIDTTYATTDTINLTLGGDNWNTFDINRQSFFPSEPGMILGPIDIPPGMRLDVEQMNGMFRIYREGKQNTDEPVKELRVIRFDNTLFVREVIRPQVVGGK